ncbi:transglutaminase family protein [Mariniflexile jejuense]|uniref:Transglutaminase family protein n=1 Tax=Mariniflexile jejuense TaxID=1173582 RepID=A0ABW3JJQ6_9FLAO
MKHSKMRLSLYLILGFVLNGFSQESTEFNLYKNLYPNSNSVRLNQKTTVTISLNANDINITQEIFEEDLYLDESANYNSKKALFFSSFFELEKVEASSFSFVDGKYKEIEVKEFKEKDELDQSFYDDSKSLNFIYPNLKKGSKSKLKYIENVKNPRFLSPFYFGDFYPIVNNKVTIIADKNIDLIFKEFNTEGLELSFKKEEKKNSNIYSWEVKNMDKYKYEPSTPTYKKILPHIVPIITSYKSNNTNTSLANKVSDLYGWYYSLVKDINQEPADENLVALVNELIKDKPTELEKVKAIYYWTQQNIKYIAFEYALGGFIPRQANDVFQKKYGDCKDNSSILYKMLDIAGIKGDLTWIGTRSIPYNYTEVPTPIVDNHMILSYTNNNDTYFLDATGRYIPIDYPTSFIQGKEALISKDGSNYIIKKVPVVPASKNAVIDTTKIDIINENIIGKSKVEITGYNKIETFNYLENEKTVDKIKAFYNTRLQKGNNKFLIDSLTETNKYDYEKNLIVDYSFNINNYAKKLGNELFVNLNLVKDLASYKTEEDRKNEIEYDYKNHFNYTTILNIPAGYSVEYLPENVNLSNNYVSSSITYEVKNNTIIYNHIYNLDFINLTLAEQKDVNNLIKKIETAFKEVVILKKL